LAQILVQPCEFQVSGACIFSGQPFNCATSGFAGDTLAWHADIALHRMSASSKNDHCRQTPQVSHRPCV
jgi:hypothetical protein